MEIKGIKAQLSLCLITWHYTTNTFWEVHIVSWNRLAPPPLGDSVRFVALCICYRLSAFTWLVSCAWAELWREMTRIIGSVVTSTLRNHGHVITHTPPKTFILGISIRSTAHSVKNGQVKENELYVSFVSIFLGPYYCIFPVHYWILR
jgi:hypothetical protein